MANRRIAQGFARLYLDERAQASLEYTLLLFVAVSFFLIVSRVLLKPFAERLQATLGKKLEQALFPSDGSFHVLKLGR